jgi:hypothetical protein
MQSFRDQVARTGAPAPAHGGKPVKSVFPERRPPLRRFFEGRGGRRLGDRIAYVTKPEFLEEETGLGAHWTEDRDFSEAHALKKEPGLAALLDIARRTGIALCIKG